MFCHPPPFFLCPPPFFMSSSWSLISSSWSLTSCSTPPRRWCAQAGRATAGDLQLCEQGVLAGEGHGQDEGRVGARE